MSNPDVAIRIAKTQIAQVLELLNTVDLFDEDEQLKLDTLEGETDLHPLIKRLLDGCEEDETTIEALKAQIDTRKARSDRLSQRVDARRKAIGELLDAAQLTKLVLPEATLSVRLLKPKAKVFDVDQLPEGFYTEEVIRKADAEKIKAHGESGAPLLPGLTWTNGGTSLTIRRR